MLYLAWIAAVSLVLLLMPAYSSRYLLFAYPPAMVLLFSLIEKIGSSFEGNVRQWLAGTALLLVAIPGFMVPRPYLEGPQEAADYIVRKHPDRVLYRGVGDGQFIFCLRASNPQLQTIVLRWDKIPEIKQAPEKLPEFAARYGIQYLVLEERVWRGLCLLLPSRWNT
jgi:hypothetical protein